MNKIVKGSIAAAAAVVLLGGGMGSLAYWQATATTPGVEIQTGNLSFTADDAAAMTYTVNGTSMSLTDIQNRRLSPGDTFTMTQWLYFDVNGSPTVLTVGAIVLDGYSSELNDALDVSYAFGDPTSQRSFSFSATTTPGKYNVYGNFKVPLTITVEWPADADDNGLQLKPLSIADTTLTLDQVTEALPTS